MHAFAASDTASEVETINKFHSVHRFVILNMGADLVLLFDLDRDPGQNLFHVLRRKLLVVLLEEFLERGVVRQIPQRFECRRDRRYPGQSQSGRTKKIAPVYSGRTMTTGGSTAMGFIRIAHGEFYLAATGCRGCGPGAGLRPGNFG